MSRYPAEEDSGWSACVMRDDPAVPELPVSRVIARMGCLGTIESSARDIWVHGVGIARVGETPFRIMLVILAYVSHPPGRVREQRSYVILQQETPQERAAKRLEAGARVVEGSGEIPRVI